MPNQANPETSDRPRRRTLTAAEKERILKEVDQAAGRGAIGWPTGSALPRADEVIE
jgi:hypothetical protein